MGGDMKHSLDRIFKAVTRLKTHLRQLKEALYQAVWRHSLFSVTQWVEDGGSVKTGSLSDLKNLNCNDGNCSKMPVSISGLDIHRILLLLFSQLSKKRPILLLMII